MRTIQITQEQFEEFKRLQTKYRQSWPATFSTNCHGRIWPYGGRGYTREKARADVRGDSKVLDEVADEYLRIRPAGGRFFVNKKGAYYSEDGENLIDIVAFVVSE